MSDDIHALSGAYAVDAVDDIERAKFEEHLARCAECRTEVASLRAAAGQLAELGIEAPPPALRSRVLAGIQEVRPLPPLSDDALGSAPRESATAPRPRRRSWRTRWIAIAAAIVVLGGGGLAVTQPWAPDQSQLTMAERVLQAPDATRVQQTFPDGATAVVVVSKSVGHAVITTTAMPLAPAGKAYQLWLQTPEGSMEPAGMMPPLPDQTFLLEGDAADATAVGITVEPAHGSSAPTSAPIALFELS